MQKDDFFYFVDNSFDKSGIGYQMVINPLKNITQIWKTLPQFRYRSNHYQRHQEPSKSRAKTKFR